VFAAQAAAAGPTWLAQQALSSNVSPASDTQVAMDNNGDALSVWVRGGSVEYSYRPAGGSSSWSTATAISGAGGAADDLQVSMNQSGDAVAVWDDSATGEVYAASFSTGTGVFGTAQTVAGSGDNRATTPDVAVDNGGNAEVVWIYNDGTQNILQAAFWPGSSGSFQSTQSLTTDSHAAANPQVAFDSGGDAVAAWQQSDGTDTLIYWAVQPSGETSFATFTALSADGADAADLRLAGTLTASGDTGGVVAIWDDDENDLDAAYMPIGSLTFNSPQSLVSTATNPPTLPAVALDGLGNAVAVWEQSDGTSLRINSAYLEAGSASPQQFGSITKISTAGDSSTNPLVATDASGGAIAVWQDNTATQIEGAVAAPPSNGSLAFGSPTAISTAGSPASPSVGIDSAGDGVAGWQQGSPVQAQVAGYDVGPQYPNIQVPNAPYAGHAVSLSANITDVWSSPSTSSWTFGDGSPNGSSTDVSHTYASTGSYTASLAVTDAAGVQTSTPGQSVTVGNRPAAVPGGLFQLDSPNDCVTGASWGCGNLLSNVPTDDAYQPAVSPDGKNVYMANLSSSVTEFSRNPSTGALTEIGCVASVGVGATNCAQIPDSGLSGPAGVVVSPDGAYVYVIGQFDNAIVTFSRNQSTGALTWLGCIGESGSSCATQTGTGVDNPYEVAAYGDNVYVSSNGNGGEVAEFTRNASTGLTENGCISGSGSSGCGVTTAVGMTNAIGVAVSPDGDNVYVEAGGTSPGPSGGDVAEFSRDPSTGELTQLASPNNCVGGTSSGCGNTGGTAIDGTEDMALSPDGRFAYVNSSTNGSVVELSRNTSTGALSQIGCVTTNSSGCATNNVTGLVEPLGVAVSPDGANLYASGAATNAELAFARNPSTGLLTQLSSPFNCITKYPSGIGCGEVGAPGLQGARRVAVSPDGKNVYVAGQGSNALVELSRSPADADLALSVSGAPATIAPGGSFAYTYTVTDNGPASVTDPVVRIALSSLLTGSSAVPSQGSCSGDTCSLGPMDGGTSATIQVPVTAASIGTATTTASVSSELTDPNTANNSVSSATTVKAPASTTTSSNALSAPKLHKTADAYAVSGKVYVKLPGSKKFIPLSQAKTLPIGTVIDARHGTVELVFAKPGGGTMEGQYWQGEFTFAQAKNGNVTVTLVGGDLAACKRTSKRHAPVAIAAGGRGRSLWSHVKGRFTTKGRAASGSVRGTEWLTQDTCAGTRISVTIDKVLVTNLKTHKTHLIHAGHSIFIKI
jgi:6-phosphogluconolactonase (cycloisomerase 2 family)